MQTFDVFIKRQLTEDIYLKNRLVEYDIIMTKLSQRDLFSMYNFLYLSANIGDIDVAKQIEVLSEIEINSELENILEVVFSYSDIVTYLSMNADLLEQVFTGGETNMELFAHVMNLTEKSFTDISSVLNIFASPLDYYLARSFGSVEFNTRISVDRLNTLKYGNESILNNLELIANADVSSEKTAYLDDLINYLSVVPFDIFYVLSAECNTTTYLDAGSIEDYVLEKVLHDVDLETYLNSNMDDNLLLNKMIQADNIFRLLIEIGNTLIENIYSESDMFMSCSAHAGLYRYRRLDEMDGLTLADFDDISLDEIDYVTIEN